MTRPRRQLRKALFDSVARGAIVSRATPPFRAQRVEWKGAEELKLVPFGRTGPGILVKREEFDSAGYVVEVDH